jgi:hypothetical protein
MYDVVIRYEDGRRVSARTHIEDLGEACAFVLELADQLGDAPGDGAGPPKWVEIYREDRLEISVSVIRGGLLKQRVD